MSPAALALGAALVALAALVAALASRRARFYTLYSREEPTRPYLAYTGSPPLGPWGALPWAEAAPADPLFQPGSPRRCSRGFSAS